MKKKQTKDSQTEYNCGDLSLMMLVKYQKKKENNKNSHYVIKARFFVNRKKNKREIYLG